MEILDSVPLPQHHELTGACTDVVLSLALPRILWTLFLHRRGAGGAPRMHSLETSIDGRNAVGCGRSGGGLSLRGPRMNLGGWRRRERMVVGLGGSDVFFELVRFAWLVELCRRRE